MAPPSSKPAPDIRPALGSIRLQAAVVRALLDEVEERTPPPGTADDVVDQLAEELERLGRGALEASRAIARSRSSVPPSSDEDDALEPMAHWLPAVRF